MAAAASPLAAGEAVVYQSASQGPIHATVITGPYADGTYDLSCKSRVPTSRITRTGPPAQSGPPTQPQMTAVGGHAADAQPYAIGEEVVYHSASQGAVQAKVVGGPHPDGSYDLDCKSRVPPARISRSSGRPTTPPQSQPQPAASGSGDPCFFRRESGEWVPAQSLRFHHSDGTYDLDCKEHAHPDNVHFIREGDQVEYHSASSGNWIPARVLQRGRVQGTFDLDCKEAVSLGRIRPVVDDSFGRTPDTEPVMRGSNPGSTAPVLKLDPTLEAYSRPSVPQSGDSETSLPRVVVDVEAFFPGRRNLDASPPPTCTKADVGEQRLAVIAMEQAIMRRDPTALHEAIHRVTSMGIAGPDVTRAVEMLRAMGGRLQRRPLSTAAVDRVQQPSMADMVTASRRGLGEDDHCDEPGLITSLFGPAPPPEEGPGLLTQLLGPKPSEDSGFLSRFFGSSSEDSRSLASMLLGTDSCDDLRGDPRARDPRLGEAPLTNPQMGRGAGPGGGCGGQPGTAPQLGPGRAGAAPSTNPQLGPGYAPGGAAEASHVPPTQVCLSSDSSPGTNAHLGPGCVPGTNPQLGHGQAPTAIQQLGHGQAGQAPTTNPQLGHGQAPTTNPQLGYGHAPGLMPQAPGTNLQLGQCPAPRPKAPSGAGRPPPGVGGAPLTNPQLGIGHAPPAAGAAMPTEPQLHPGPWAQQLPQNPYAGQGHSHAGAPIM